MSALPLKADLWAVVPRYHRRPIKEWYHVSYCMSTPTTEPHMTIRYG